MKPLTLHLHNFQLKEFIADVTKKGEGILEPGVMPLDTIEQFDIKEVVNEEYSTDELYDMLVKEGKYLYANFTGSNFDGEVPCINGTTFPFRTEEDAKVLKEEEIQLPENFQPVNDYFLTEESSVGVLVKYEDEKITSSSVILDMNGSGFSGPCSFRGYCDYTTITYAEDVEIFEEPMKEYLSGFVNWGRG